MKIVVYSHLQRGGARKIWDKLVEDIKKNVEIYDFSEKENIIFKNFIQYLIYIYIILPKKQRLLAEEIKKIDYDVAIVSHHYLTKSPYLLRYIKNCLYICHEEPREFYEDKKYLINSKRGEVVNLLRLPLKIIDKINVSYAKKIITNSEYSKNKLKNIYKKKIDIIKMPLLLQNQENNYIRENHFLTIGATSIFKGIDFIVESISNLPNNYKYPLIVVGDRGRDYNYILKLANKYNIKLIIYHNISEKKLIKLYKTSKLLLAAAHNEPFGLSLIEALSFSLPVVSVNEGGYEEIIDRYVIKSNYGIISKRDPVIFAKSIVKMLENNKREMKIEKYIRKKYNINLTLSQLLNEVKKI